MRIGGPIARPSLCLSGAVATGNGPALAVTASACPVAATWSPVAFALSNRTVAWAPLSWAKVRSNGPVTAASRARPTSRVAVHRVTMMPISAVCVRRRRTAARATAQVARITPPPAR
jgi:hypothetical protein